MAGNPETGIGAGTLSLEERGRGGRGYESMSSPLRAEVIVCSGYFSDPVMSDHAAHGSLGVPGKPYRIEEL